MIRQKMLVLACAVTMSGFGFDSAVQAGPPVGAYPVAAANTPLPAQFPSTGYPTAGNQAFGRQWAGTYSSQDWERFYHYPYVWYPQNFWGDEYYRSADSLYYRYPPEMRVPVYNKQWHNMYPEGATYDKYLDHRHKGPAGGGKYHSGHHFILDTF